MDVAELIGWEVIGGTFLDSPLSYAIHPTDWDSMLFPGYWASANVSYSNTRIPKEVITPWVDESPVIQTRYEYYFKSGGLECRCGSCGFRTARGDFSCSTMICPNCARKGLSTVDATTPIAVWYAEAGNWGAHTFERYMALSAASTFWYIQNQFEEWLKVTGFLQHYHLVAGVLPQQIAVTVSFALVYRRVKHSVVMGYDNIEEAGTITKTQTKGIVFTVNDYPAANPIIAPDRCTCSKTENDEVLPTDMIHFEIAVDRNTPNWNQYATKAFYVGVSCKGYTQVLWTGRFEAGQLSLKIPIDITPAALANEPLSSEQYIYPRFIAGNGEVYNSMDAGWFKQFTLQIIPIVGPHGTISVQSTPSGATFTISGPVSLGGMTPYPAVNAPAGTYTITWGSMVGYTKPAPSTKLLADGASITFNGVYIEGAEPPPPPPDGTNKGLIVAGVGGAGLMLWALLRKGR